VLPSGVITMLPLPAPGILISFPSVLVAVANGITPSELSVER
jgi:hypothetical protein